MELHFFALVIELPQIGLSVLEGLEDQINKNVLAFSLPHDVDFLHLESGEVVEDKVSVYLHPHYWVQLLLVYVLHTQQAIVPQHYLLVL